jgi:hypothetical protein
MIGAPVRTIGGVRGHADHVLRFTAVAVLGAEEERGRDACAGEHVGDVAELLVDAGRVGEHAEAGPTQASLESGEEREAIEADIHGDRCS